MQSAPPETPAPPTPEPAKTEAESIPFHDRFVLWMFLLGFVFFGVILLGEMLSGFFR
jgi:hypothetical protein